MKRAKHQAISMTQNQQIRLALLAEKLGMTKSDVVNHLVWACINIQVLQDLIKSNNDFPGKITKFAHSKHVNIVQAEIEENQLMMMRIVNNRCEAQRLQEIAREKEIERHMLMQKHRVENKGEKI